MTSRDKTKRATLATKRPSEGPGCEASPTLSARRPYLALSRGPVRPLLSLLPLLLVRMLLLLLLMGDLWPEKLCCDFPRTDRQRRTGGGHGARADAEHPSLADLTATQDAWLNPDCRASPRSGVPQTEFLPDGARGLQPLVAAEALDVSLTLNPQIWLSRPGSGGLPRVIPGMREHGASGSSPD